jgi:hypothetical protein
MSLKNLVERVKDFKLNKTFGLNLALSTLLYLTSPVFADTHYVSKNGYHQTPFTSWNAASKDIQSAVDVAEDGDIVMIADGVYNVPKEEGIQWDGNSKHLTIQSKNGPEKTIIDCKKKGR